MYKRQVFVSDSLIRGFVVFVNDSLYSLIRGLFVAFVGDSLYSWGFVGIRLISLFVVPLIIRSLQFNE